MLPAAIIKDSFLRLMLIKEAFVISAGSVLADYKHFDWSSLVLKQLLHQGLKFIDVLFRESPHAKITMIGIPLLIGDIHL